MSSPVNLHHYINTSSPQTLIPSLSISSKNHSTSLREQLSKLCKAGRLDAARRIFFESKPNTILWNTLLIGYVCNYRPLEALRLYAIINNSKNCTIADHYTYSSVLKACADAGKLRLGKAIHCRIIRSSTAVMRKNRVISNSLLNMYASTLEVGMQPGSRDVVRLVFDRMPKRNAVAWNTLIDWYVRTGRPEVALDQFRIMVEVGIRLTTVSFINVFPAVAAVANVENEGMRKRLPYLLYGLLVKYGSDYVADQFVVSSAIFLFCELGDVQSARKVFDQTEEKNTEVWNTMISGYVQNGQFEEALSLLIKIVESNTVNADTVTFLSSLMAVSQLQDVSLGRQIHACMIKEYCLAEQLILWNAVVVMYSRCGYVKAAFEIFEQMLDRDIVSWNTMISAFVQNKFNLEGLLLIHEMLKEGFCLDSVTVMALLSAASELGSIRIGKQAHGYLIRHGIQCEGIESYLIDMYAKSGCVETAKQLFDRDQSDKRDLVTWNAMIAGYTQNGQTEEAMVVFRNMLEAGQMPSSVTLASVLPACSPIGGIQTGKQIHGFAIRHNLDANVFVETALIDMYCKSGQIMFAERVFDSMTVKNTVTYTTMLSGFGQHGLGERALSLFHSMQESGTKPDAITFVAVISACSYSGLIDEGLAIYNSMEKFGIIASAEHYCCIVDLLGRAGRVEEAYQFLQKLGDEGNFVGIWGSLLASCRIHRKIELAELVAEKLFKIGKENGLAGYHVLLANAYAADMNWNSVDRVRKEMRKRGLKKEPGFSWIQFRDSSHRFISRDQMHPEVDQIYSVLKELTLGMKSSKDLEPCFVDGGSGFD